VKAYRVLLVFFLSFLILFNTTIQAVGSAPGTGAASATTSTNTKKTYYVYSFDGIQWAPGAGKTAGFHNVNGQEFRTVMEYPLWIAAGISVTGGALTFIAPEVVGLDLFAPGALGIGAKTLHYGWDKLIDRINPFRVDPSKFWNGSSMTLKIGERMKQFPNDTHHKFSVFVESFAKEGFVKEFFGDDGRRYQILKILGYVDDKIGVFEWMKQISNGVINHRFFNQF
jgi:hypothetical protein